MKNILLVGGSYGIGKALAQLLAAENQVWIASRTASDLPLGVTHLPFDATTDRLEISKLPKMLHGFVYCPGNIDLKPFRALKPEDFARAFEISVLHMIRHLQEVLPLLKNSENASVVLFSTVAVAQGMPFHTSVSTAKGALEGFAKAFAAEHAPGIRANVIAPSLTDTPLAQKWLSSEDKIEKAAQRHPLKRVGKAEDIAQSAAFLLSNQASWITGQVWAVDGGLSTLKT